MTCEICKKREAVIHMQENSPGGIRTVNLCLECAAVKGLNIRSEDVGKLFMNFVSNIFGTPADKTVDMSSVRLLDLKCPSCGKTLEKITEEHKAGCQTCFSEFSKVIDILLFKYNNSLDYKGSLPPDVDQKRQYKLQVLDLKKQLRECIKMDNYSQAIEVRDKIKSLKKRYATGQVNDE